MEIYILSFFILLFFLTGYIKLADHFNIIDKPNERSSHSSVTIRGGGIVFPAATLLWFLLFGFNQPWIIFSLLLMAVVSFLDDVTSLPYGARIIAHFVAVSCLFWQTHIFGFPWYGIVLAYLFTIGWINAFNFMDGINGITPFYGFVALISFFLVNQTVNFTSENLLLLLILSVVIFSFFNARKTAKVFAGDVGSISLAFILAWLMVTLMGKTGRIEYILFFALYGIDTVITIIFRLRRKENIFKAHRTHLFQYLSNEMGMSQILVSMIYAIIQLLINVLVIGLIEINRMNFLYSLFLFAGLTLIYLLVRLWVTSIINARKVLAEKKNLY